MFLVTMVDVSLNTGDNRDNVKRPKSDELVDIHVYLIPSERWIEQRRLAKNIAMDYSVSAGFVRVHPSYSLRQLRGYIVEQLESAVPENFVFLRSVGRNLTQVKPKQENELRVKSFMPPQAEDPEVYLKEGTYAELGGEDSGVEENSIEDRRAFLSRKRQPLSSRASGIPQHNGMQRKRKDTVSNHTTQRKTDGKKGRARRGSVAKPAENPNRKKSLKSEQPVKVEAKEDNEVADQAESNEVEIVAEEKAVEEDESGVQENLELAEKNSIVDLGIGDEQETECIAYPEGYSEEYGHLELEETEYVRQYGEGETGKNGYADEETVDVRGEETTEFPDNAEEQEGGENHYAEGEWHEQCVEQNGEVYGENGETDVEATAEGLEGTEYIRRRRSSTVEGPEVTEHVTRRRSSIVEGPEGTEHIARRRSSTAEGPEGIEHIARRRSSTAEGPEGIEHIARRRSSIAEGPEGTEHITRRKSQVEQNIIKREEAEEEWENRKHLTDLEECQLRENGEGVNDSSEGIMENGDFAQENVEAMNNEEQPANEATEEQEGDKSQHKDQEDSQTDEKEAVDAEGNKLTEEEKRELEKKERKEKREKLLKTLERVRMERKYYELQRTELLKRAKEMKKLKLLKFEEAREIWMKRYQQVKKTTPKLEDECAQLRKELEHLVREMLNQIYYEEKTAAGKNEPCKKTTYKLTVLKVLQEIEDLRQRVQSTKIKLKAEIELRKQAESDVKRLREELLKKKIQVSLTRDNKTGIKPATRAFQKQTISALDNDLNNLRVGI